MFSCINQHLFSNFKIKMDIISSRFEFAKKKLERKNTVTPLINVYPISQEYGGKFCSLSSWDLRHHCARCINYSHFMLMNIHCVCNNIECEFTLSLSLHLHVQSLSLFLFGFGFFLSSIFKCFVTPQMFWLAYPAFDS